MEEGNTVNVDNFVEPERQIGCCCYFFWELAVIAIIIVVVLPVVLLWCMLEVCCGFDLGFIPERRRHENMQCETPVEMRTYIEYKLITRTVLAAADGKHKTRFSEVVGDMSSRDAVYSPLVAAIRLPPSDRSIEFSEPTLGSSSCPNLSEAAENASAVDEQRHNKSIQSDGGTERRICNPIVRSISSSLRSLSQVSTSERPFTCNICLLDFEVGEEVCWSPNEDCVHAYHKECIIPWLMNNPSCPACRRNYLQDTKGKIEVENSNDQDEDNAAEPEAV